MIDPNYAQKIEDLRKYYADLRKTEVTAEQVQLELVDNAHARMLKMNKSDVLSADEKGAIRGIIS